MNKTKASYFLSSRALYPELGLLWSPISPLGIQGGLCGTACSHCHQTEKDFLDFGSLCLEWSSVWPSFSASGPFQFFL